MRIVYKYRMMLYAGCILFIAMRTSAQTFMGYPMKLPCGVTQNPQIICNMQDFNSTGCKSTLPSLFDFMNETLIGSLIKTGGAPLIGYSVQGQRQGNYIYVTLSVCLDGYSDANLSESVWFTIPRINKSNRVIIDVKYEYVDVCTDCKVLDLPLMIEESVVVQNDKEYLELSENRNDFPEIDFDKYSLIGYSYVTIGSSSKKRPRYFIAIDPQKKHTNITLIEVGPGLDLYNRIKKVIWFIVPKSIPTDNVSIHRKYFLL